jgi:hypothetical protein
MAAPRKRLRTRPLVSAITAATLAGILVGVTLYEGLGSTRPSARRLADVGIVSSASNRVPDAPPAVAPPPCAAATSTTLASVDTTVAQLIYNGEIHSKEVRADIAHITGSRELLSAMASGGDAAVQAAVHTIVYTPHWHIVRLRVVEHGHVLADVGGPDIIAPVSGTLSLKGRVLGRYVMSVQDDLGYVKLVSRFIGVPVDLYRGGSLVMGTLRPAPAPPSTGARVTVAGEAYRAQTLEALAFPNGALRVALFIPAPTDALARQSCVAVRVAAWGGVAKRIAARLHPLAAHYGDLVHTLRGSTGGLAFVRAGSKPLAGGAAPARIPRSGTLSYRGRSWSVFSWEPEPPARIYFLTPTA